MDTSKLDYNLAIGHNRYSTAGDNIEQDAQPLLFQDPGIAIAHNGQITNYLQLKKKIEENSSYSFFTSCDLESLLFVLSNNIKKRKPSKSMPSVDFVEEIVFPALQELMNSEAQYGITGAYSVVSIIANRGLLGFKDPRGIRPLCFAQKEGQYAFASETTALHLLKDFQNIRELAPGEAVFIDLDFNIYSKIINRKNEKACPFEAVYFAQVDSSLYGQQVYDSRKNLGLALAECFAELEPFVDTITPVPKSPIPAALALARAWNKNYGGIVARPSHSPIRAFQQEKQERENSIDEKFLFIRSHIEGKRVGVVDDSIVRGETSTGIIKRLYELGAKEVHFFSTYPPYIGICPGGIDVAEEDELLLHGNSDIEIEKARLAIGATTLNYLPLKKMLKAINLETACLGCTQKQYPFDMSGYEEFQKLRKEQRLNCLHC